MKILTIILAVTFSLCALADHHEGSKKDKKGMKSEKLSEVKAMMTKNINARIAALEKHKTCVNSAADKDALQKCRKDMKEFHDGQKDMRQEMRKNMKEKRKNNKK